MQVVPSLDIQNGRSRLVWWPGASSGVGTPTDRPEVIAVALAELGAPYVHVVDLDGARLGRPANLTAIGAIARAVAKPLQLAGGVDGPEQIEIAFAAGATRIVLPLWSVAEDHAKLAQCLRIAGDWLAIGLDARPASLHDYPWRQRAEPGLDELVVELGDLGVRRFVFSHARTAPEHELVASLARRVDAEVMVAGGVSSLHDLLLLRDGGVAGVILGEALFTGAISLNEALEAVG